MELFLIMFFIVVFGRFIGTVIFLQSLRLFGKVPSISFKEITFMWLAGMIRGAIAFGLVLRLNDSLENKSVIVTTSLSLVLVTTLIFGSSLGLVARCMFGNPNEQSQKLKKSNGTNKTIQEEENEDEEDDGLMSDGSKSSYEEFQHPNSVFT